MTHAPTDPIALAKTQLRAQVRQRVLAMTAAQRADASERIADTLTATPAFARAAVCLAYLALPDEPDLISVLTAILASGRALALPRVQWADKSMHAAIVNNLSTDLLPTRPGFLEPTQNRPHLPPSALGLTIVPALAYDPATRVRLGRGGGVYDRWLTGYAGATRAPFVPGRGGSDPVVVGVCFDEQLVENLPTHPHDARVDAIVTDRRIIDPGGRLGLG